MDDLNVEGLRTLVAQLNDATHALSESQPPTEALQGQILGTSRQIAGMVTQPPDLAFIHSANMLEMIAIRTLMSLGVLETLPVVGEMSLTDLAVAVNAQENLLKRLLRLVTCTGFTRHDNKGNYGHTKYSLAYRKGMGPGAFFVLMYDNCLGTMGRLPDYLKERGATEPVSSKYCPYTWAFNQEGTSTWEVMAQDPERLAAFQQGLAGAEHDVPLTSNYDFNQLATQEDRPVFVDVGGGAGQAILAVLSQSPSLRPQQFVLQDLPEILELAEKSGKLPQGVQTMKSDFFQDQPVHGAKSYYMRRIMHDYSDENCIQILSHLAKAAAPDSRILIADIILPEVVTPADIGGAVMDICMLVMGGKERTVTEFEALLKNAGLELVQVYHLPGKPGGLIEARLMQ